MTERNPFDSDDESNPSPFADDSVAAAAVQPSMQELQPLDADGGGGGAYGDDGSSPFAENPPPAAPDERSPRTGSPKPASPKDAELLRREQELDRREAELRRREAALRSGGGANAGEPAYNWPFPPYWRITYHSIASEIPVEHKKHCRLFYLTWMALACTLVYNFFLELSLYFSGNLSDSNGSPTLEVLFAFVYMLLGIIFSWRTWYRDIYYAYRDAKTRKWISFFIFFSCNIAWCAFMFIGYPGSAVAGLVFMLDAFSSLTAGWGLAMLVMVILSGCLVACSIYLIKAAHSTYTTGGHSKKAKKEITREVGRAALESQINDDPNSRV